MARIREAPANRVTRIPRPSEPPKLLGDVDQASRGTCVVRRHPCHTRRSQWCQSGPDADAQKGEGHCYVGEIRGYLTRSSTAMPSPAVPRGPPLLAAGPCPGVRRPGDGVDDREHDEGDGQEGESGLERAVLTGFLEDLGTKKNIEYMPLTNSTRLSKPRSFPARKQAKGRDGLLGGVRSHDALSNAALAADEGGDSQAVAPPVRRRPRHPENERGHAKSRSGCSQKVEVTGRRSVSGRYRGAKATSAIPMGTLMNSPHRHETQLVNMPPRTRPTLPPPPATAL